ncbi:hypothetical protein ABT354_12810 [Streptomyces sp. NPDC000594]|uniref:hypothetical protein n=1 Tax=Streptomyces sp. NPDC000594 TaxID=3154261 RepID=UPI00332063C1
MNRHDARMEYWAEFFVAPEDTVTAESEPAVGADGGPAALPVDYDPEAAMAAWQALFANTSVRSRWRRTAPPEPAEATHDGCRVLVVPDPLVTHLARADRAQRERVAHAWVRLRRASGEDMSTSDAVAHLTALSSLATHARTHGRRLYAYMN